MDYIPFFPQLRNRTGASASAAGDGSGASEGDKQLRGFKSVVYSMYEKLFGGRGKAGDDNGKVAQTEEFKVLGVDLSRLSPRW